MRFTGKKLHWQTTQGEWRYTGEGALENPGGSAAAHAPVPMQDFVLSVRVTPEKNREPQAGVIFRGDADGSNRYCFRARQRGLFMLQRTANGGTTEMAARTRVPVDDSYTLTVIATGWRLRCFVDGRKIYDVTDRAPIFGNHAGVSTLETAARFEEFQVEAVTEKSLEPLLQALARQGVARREREYGFRHRVIDLKGRSGYVAVGDLDGDGVPDFVAMQGTRYLTGVTQHGEILWAMENPDGWKPPHPECHYPNRIYDIDGDGANEVICRWHRDRKEFVYILDGRTGAIKRELAWDHTVWPDSGREYIERIVIANLRGLETPRDLVIVGPYAGVWAFTDELEPLWAHGMEEFPGKGGPLPWMCHQPAVADLDGDGCDEIACGGMLLDQDGKVLWTIDTYKETSDSHIDSIRIADVDGDPSNGLEIAYSTGACLLDAKGNFYWRHLPLVLHGQQVRLGKIRPDVPGLQVLVADNDRAGANYLFSATGELLLKVPNAGCIDLADWNGDGLDEIVSGATLYDGYGKVLAELPIEEVHMACGYEYPKTSYTFFTIADVSGDAREEIIWMSGDLIIIFENAAPNPHPPLQLISAQKEARWKKLYNYTGY